jgi:hypothetical protein
VKPVVKVVRLLTKRALLTSSAVKKPARPDIRVVRLLIENNQIAKIVRLCTKGERETYLVSTIGFRGNEAHCTGGMQLVIVLPP